MRTAIAQERAVPRVAGMVLPALEDSHGAGNCVLNALGEAMNGLSEHNVVPVMRSGTHTLRNQAITQLR